jgi:hypothetical protein
MSSAGRPWTGNAHFSIQRLGGVLVFGVIVLTAIGAGIMINTHDRAEPEPPLSLRSTWKGGATAR